MCWRWRLFRMAERLGVTLAISGLLLFGGV